MKNTLHLLIVCFFFAVSEGISQVNLVPNPSFEEYTECPSILGQIELTGWSSYRESPDYFNSCSNVQGCSVPINIAGYQNPATGNAYCGFQTFFTSNLREYLGVQLISPLEIGKLYNLSFKIVRAHGGLMEARCATNKIGLKFSTTPYDFDNPSPINNFAHLYSDEIITDTSNWTIISGTFVADLPYDYIMLGNFFDDNNTDTIIYESTCRAFYFVDDVSVNKETSGAEVSNTSMQSFSVFPIPAKEQIVIKSDFYFSAIRIINSYGSVVKCVNIDNLNDIIIDISTFEKGVYYIELKISDELVTKKITVI